MTTITSIATLIECAVNHDGDCYEIDVNLTLHEEGKNYSAYAVSIAHRELLFYCDNACLTYVIDSYGNSHTYELFSIEESED